MGWIVFEALLALSVMLLFVWWTTRGRREPEETVAEDVPTVPAPDDRAADRP